MRRRFVGAVCSWPFARSRGVWNLFRLENEHLDNCGEFRAARALARRVSFARGYQYTLTRRICPAGPLVLPFSREQPPPPLAKAPRPLHRARAVQDPPGAKFFGRLLSRRAPVESPSGGSLSPSSLPSPSALTLTFCDVAHSGGPESATRPASPASLAGVPAGILAATRPRTLARRRTLASVSALRRRSHDDSDSDAEDLAGGRPAARGKTPQRAASMGEATAGPAHCHPGPPVGGRCASLDDSAVPAADSPPQDLNFCHV